MDIRLAAGEELETVRCITHQTISEIYPHFYPGGVVEFFLGLHSKENIAEDIARSKTYLAVDDGECVGTITIDGNEISRLFILPAHQNKGYGTALMDFAEREIFERYSEIELHASLSGKKMYLERGYREKEYRRKRLENGDWICVDIMCKSMNMTVIPYIKKSFPMFFGGGEIWFEHLDGIHEHTEFAIEKLERDYQQFKRPSMPSLIAINLDETVVTEALISAVADKLLKGDKRFTRVVFVGVDKKIKRKIERELAGASFVLSFINDFEKAKEWLVGK